MSDSVLIRTLTEQRQEAVRLNIPYVCLLSTRGENWTWYVDATFRNQTEALAWFDAQPGSARVYRVKRTGAEIFCAR